MGAVWQAGSGYLIREGVSMLDRCERLPLMSARPNTPGEKTLRKAKTRTLYNSWEIAIC